MQTATATATASEIAARLTAEGKKFLLELCGVAGNNVNTAEELKYYRDDLYTWYDASDLLGKYSKNEIGGFLSNLHNLKIVDGKGREAGLTAFGVEVAIAVAYEAEAQA